MKSGMEIHFLQKKFTLVVNLTVYFLNLYMLNCVAVSTESKSSSRRTFWTFYSHWNSKNGRDTEFWKVWCNLKKKVEYLGNG